MPKLKIMLKYFSGSQAKYIKMSILFAFVVWIFWLFASKRITMKKLRKYKAMLSMVIQAMSWLISRIYQL